MSRNSDINQWVIDNGAITSSGTTTDYLPVPYDILVVGVHVMGINPAAVDADTLRVVLDHAAFDVAASYTTIADSTADEYNDTTDTASLAAVTGTPDARAVALADWGNLAFPGTRVAGNSFLRFREIWTGTVTDGQIVSVVSYKVLNDTSDTD